MDMEGGTAWMVAMIAANVTNISVLYV